MDELKEFQIQKLKLEIKNLSKKPWQNPKYLSIFLPLIVTLIVGIVKLDTFIKNEKNEKIKELKQENEKLSLSIMELRLNNIDNKQQQLKLDKTLLDIEEKEIKEKRKYVDEYRKQLEADFLYNKKGLDNRLDSIYLDYQQSKDSLIKNLLTLNDSLSFAYFNVDSLNTEIGQLLKTKDALEIQIESISYKINLKNFCQNCNEIFSLLDELSSSVETYYKERESYKRAEETFLHNSQILSFHYDEYMNELKTMSSLTEILYNEVNNLKKYKINEYISVSEKIEDKIYNIKNLIDRYGSHNYNKDVPKKERFRTRERLKDYIINEIDLTSSLINLSNKNVLTICDEN